MSVVNWTMLRFARVSAWPGRGFSSLSAGSSADGTTQTDSFQRFNGVIPHEVVEKRFLLASGAGGQHIHKNATKVQIRVKLDENSCAWLAPPLREAVVERLENRINACGEVIIESDRTRERQMNLADAIDKLRSTIYDVQRHMESRRKTEEDAAKIVEKAARAARHRLAEKRRISQKKESRRVEVVL